MGGRAVRSFVATLLGLAVLGTSLPPVLAGQASPTSSTPQDLALGRWRLIVAKSKYIPGPAPTSEVRTYERRPDGLHATVSRVFPGGRKESITYGANMDSVNPVSGAPEYDTVKLRRINEYESEAVLAHADVIFGIARRVVSRDGKTLTITFKRDTQPPVYNIAVYEKEP